MNVWATSEQSKDVNHERFSSDENKDDPPTSKINPLSDFLTPKYEELTNDQVIEGRKYLSEF